MSAGVSTNYGLQSVPSRYVIDENSGNIIQIAEDFGIFDSGKGTGC